MNPRIPLTTRQNSTTSDQTFPLSSHPNSLSDRFINQKPFRKYKLEGISSHKKRSQESESKFQNIRLELEKTKKDLKWKKCKKNLWKIKNDQKESAKPASSFFMEETLGETAYKSFNEFMQKKKKQNVYLRTKMKIFGTTISDHEKALLQNDIKSQIKKVYNLDASDEHDHKADEKKGRYIIGYMILTKFLQMLVKNPEQIHLRQEYSDIYLKLKEEMMSIILDERSMFQKEEKESGWKFDLQKLLEEGRGKKPFYLRKEKPKNFYAQQIQKLMGNCQNYIIQCLHQLNYNELVEQFQQQWSRFQSMKC